MLLCDVACACKTTLVSLCCPALVEDVQLVAGLGCVSCGSQKVTRPNYAVEKCAYGQARQLGRLAGLC